MDRLRPGRPAALALVAASGAAAGLAHLPGPLGALSWAAYAPLLVLTDGLAPAEAFAFGALFGASAHACGMPWLFALTRGFLRFGALPASAVTAVVWTTLGLRWGLTAAAAAAAGGTLRRAAAFVGACVAGEAYWPSFSPSYMTFTQLFHLPTVQCAAIVGSLGLATLVFSANAALWLAAARRERRAAGAAALVLALALANEAWGRRELARVEAAAAAAPRLTVAVVQAGSPNGPWTGAKPEDESPRYARLTAAAAAEGPLDLAVWPENSYAPGEVRYGPGRSLPPLGVGAAAPPVLLNTTAVAEDGLRRNVTLLASPEGRILAFAEKRVLMPFGEFMPPGLGFLDRLIPSRDHLARGRAPGLVSVAGTTAGVAICFEDVVPGPTAQLAALGARLLVAQSNDSWFTAPHPEQHLMFGAARAVENRRALVHAARTGVSAVVWPSGRVSRRLEVGALGAFVERVPLLDERVPGPRVGPWLARAGLALSAGLSLAGGWARRAGAAA